MENLILGIIFGGLLGKRKKAKPATKVVAQPVRPAERTATKVDPVSRDTYNRQMSSFETMKSTLVENGMTVEAANDFVDKQRAEYATHHRIKRTKGGHVETLKFASKVWARTLTDIETLMSNFNQSDEAKSFEMHSRSGKLGFPQLNIKVEIVTEDE